MASIPRQVTCGLVLRETETKESDKILNVLTAELGKISVIARGARRKNSRTAAAAQFLAYSEMTLYQRGNWYMLDEASSRELFSGLRQDVELLSLGAYLAELTEAVTAEGNECGDVLRLLLNALYALSYLKKPPLLVKAAFEWRLMSLSGFEPLTDGCAFCGKQEPEEPMLNVNEGEVHCRACKKGDGRSLSMPLCPGSLAALRYVLRCPVEKLYAFKLEKDSLKRLAQAAEAFCAVQLERGFSTLNFYKSLMIESEG